MAYSKAYRRFVENQKDVLRLQELHEEKAGLTPGRKYGVEVLSKSAIVLISAYWEAYIEDVCEEAIFRLLVNTKDPAQLPEDLRMSVARRVRKDDDERAPWRLAQDGWRAMCKQHVCDKLTRLNNPKSERVRELFTLALGITDVTDSWSRRRMTKDKACEKLDGFIDLRGSIAHRGKSGATVTKKQWTDFLSLAEELAAATDKRVLKRLQELTGYGFAVK